MFCDKRSEAEIRVYAENFLSCAIKTEVTDGNGNQLGLAKGVSRAIDIIMQMDKKGKTLRFIGNGGSAGIAMHQCTDFFKSADIATESLFDPTLLTCMGNDLGYENVFSGPLRKLAKVGDVLIAISSSGKSPNIINGAETARASNNRIITMSGFGPDNPLRSTGDVNFYVPSSDYRVVESAHLFICNWILHFLIESRK